MAIGVAVSVVVVLQRQRQTFTWPKHGECHHQVLEKSEAQVRITDHTHIQYNCLSSWKKKLYLDKANYFLFLLNGQYFLPYGIGLPQWSINFLWYGYYLLWNPLLFSMTCQLFCSDIHIIHYALLSINCVIGNISTPIAIIAPVTPIILSAMLWISCLCSIHLACSAVGAI